MIDWFMIRFLKISRTKLLTKNFFHYCFVTKTAFYLHVCPLIVCKYLYYETTAKIFYSKWCCFQLITTPCLTVVSCSRALSSSLIKTGSEKLIGIWWLNHYVLPIINILTDSLFPKSPNFSALKGKSRLIWPKSKPISVKTENFKHVLISAQLPILSQSWEWDSLS